MSRRPAAARLGPRWLALTAVGLAAVVVCGLLGAWQWTRTQDILAADRAALQVPVPVEQVTRTGGDLPAESLGRPVVATGRYADRPQLLVANRELAGRPGSWVLAALTLADGSIIPVLRGWVPGAGPAADPTPGPVEVRGVLQPDEDFYAGAPTQPDGRLLRVAADTLRERWGTGVRTGFVVLSEQVPAADPQAAADRAVPQPVPPTGPTADVPFPLQNFFYAFQWWFFAAFVVFVWVRWLRLDLRETADERAAAAG